MPFTVSPLPCFESLQSFVFRYSLATKMTIFLQLYDICRRARLHWYQQELHIMTPWNLSITFLFMVVLVLRFHFVSWIFDHINRVVEYLIVSAQSMIFECGICNGRFLLLCKNLKACKLTLFNAGIHAARYWYRAQCNSGSQPETKRIHAM